MLRFLLAVSVIAATCLVYRDAVAQELPPAMKKSMEEAQRRSQADLDGPKGDEARRICMRVAGVSFPARKAPELIQQGYSVETAIKYSDCIVNYLYPVPAEKQK